MLKESIRAYCNAGENCSRIILLAAAEEYRFMLSEDILAACKGLQGGFGIGGICSAIVACVMVLGLLFDEEEVKKRRILFLLKIQERFGFLDCNRLSAGESCDVIMEVCAEVLQEVIEYKEDV